MRFWGLVSAAMHVALLVLGLLFGLPPRLEEPKEDAIAVEIVAEPQVAKGEQPAPVPGPVAVNQPPRPEPHAPSPAQESIPSPPPPPPPPAPPAPPQAQPRPAPTPPPTPEPPKPERQVVQPRPAPTPPPAPEPPKQVAQPKAAPPTPPPEPTPLPLPPKPPQPPQEVAEAKPEPPRPEPPRKEPPKPEPPRKEQAKPEPPKPPAPPQPSKETAKAEPKPAAPSPPSRETAKAEAKPPAPVPSRNETKEAGTGQSPAVKRPSVDSSSVLNTLERLQASASQGRPQAKPAQQAGSPQASGGGSPTGTASLSSGEKAGLADKISECWSVDGGGMGINAVVVELRVDVDAAGIVRNVRANGSPPSEPRARSVYEAARRALLDPKCNPLPLPKERLAALRETIFRFNPRDLGLR
ncbi:hypothetical protein [Roseicella aquatilis]|uniref:Energy transducer TonB n=1 Tax=Roseicella aquatilis TaxID=2527868 RepID=A0A4R4DR17_9PROT|nr:hypothetical protein [Roseicella aquatilis]TCZ63682.1 hypothetical protein EXY23_09875 [Roseicella aquatilis]